MSSKKDILIHVGYTRMTDFEKVLWLELENKKLKQENEVLRKTTSTKEARNKYKKQREENIKLYNINKELEAQILKNANRIKLSELKSLYKVGEPVRFLYNGEKIYSIIRTVCKNFITVEAFKDRDNGFRVKYSEIV